MKTLPRFSPRRSLSAFLLVPFLCFAFLSAAIPVPISITKAYAEPAPSAEDLDQLMKKLLESGLSEVEKKRIAAVIFYHTPTYRSAVLDGRFPADSPHVQAFLEYKGKMQVDVIERMGMTYQNKFGTPLKQPVIPFSYNNILSDDDIITGTGKTGRMLEGMYNDSLSDIIQERAGRPMTAADRARIDVNGLAWNMTQEGAFEDFRHKEKYINPQAGYANQQKLIEGAEQNKVTAYTFDDEGRIVRMSSTDTVDAIKRLEVDRPLEIPGIDATKGTGSMSDFLRMAEIHKVKFADGKMVTDDDIMHFIRNQKYSQRVIGPFQEIGAKIDPQVAQKYKRFIELSDALRAQTTTRGVAKLLEAEYKIKIIDPNGIIDFNKLTEAMKAHQAIQLTEALPQMMGSVTKSEVYKIAEWLKSAGQGDRLMLRKQMALTYAPLTDGQRATILSQVDSLSEIAEGDKAFVRQALDGDAKQIRRYADLLELEASMLSGRLKLTGDNHAVVDFVIGKNAKVKALTDAIGSRPGGSRFNQFLKSKTARALNMDVMLDFSGENKGQKFMQWSMILLAATRSYQGATDEKEGLKQMGISVFQMIPFVASALRFSEDEYREAFKEFAMDIFPPLALANLAVMALDYSVQQAKASWDDTVWDGLVREALRDLNDDDFEKTDMGYYRLKEREAYFEYIKEIAPGMGRVAKLASMVAPEVEAMMTRNEQVKTNMAALHTLQWFEKFDEESQTSYWAKQFDIEQLKDRVWEEGQLGRGSASPVERVAATILLDNLAIRLQMQDKVLSKFIDLIEKRYNDLKGEVTGDCTPPGTLEEMARVGEELNRGLASNAISALSGDESEGIGEECDPNAIVMETMAALKTLYENAPQEIKDSPWATETLQEEYSRILEYLQGYAPEGKTQLEIRKEMQEIIDGFKAFIQDLVFGAALYTEAHTLNLTAYLYGGDDVFETTDELLLGDSFRVGISARVSPVHGKDRNWKVFYYGAGPEDQYIQLLGSVDLRPGNYDPGNDEGLWLIEDPDKDTFLNVRRGDILGQFDKEGPAQVVAVLAFGDWSDPVGQVGYAALRNPIEYAQSFSPERVAFASPAVDFTIKRAAIFAKPQKPFYQSTEMPEVAFFISVAAYAQSKGAQAEFEVMAPKEDISAECYPEDMDDVSFNAEQPSLVNVIIPPDSEDGRYYVDIEAELNGLADEFQPLTQRVTFEYINADEEEGDSEEKQEDLLAQLNELQAQADAIYQKASSTYEMLANEVGDAAETLNTIEKDISRINKLIDRTDKKASAVDDNLATVKKDAGQAEIEAEKAAENRSEVQNYALECCKYAEQLKQITDVNKLKSMISDVRLPDEQVRLYKQRFEANLQVARLAKNEAVEIKGEMFLLRGDRTQVAKDILQIENVLNVVSEDIARLQELAVLVSEAVPSITNVRLQADTILNTVIAENQKKKAAKALTSEDKRFEKEAKKIVGKIGNNEKQVAGLDKKAQKKIARPSSDFEKVKKSFQEAKTNAEKLVTLPDVSEETFAQFEKYAKDARVAYDSAEIFEDSVIASAEQSSTCLAQAEAHFGRETSPEAQVAKTDCSAWPGTSAKWVASKNKTECWCAQGYVWDKGANRCVTKKDYEWARTSCASFPGTNKVWVAGKQIVECHCPSGQTWNGAKNQCVAFQAWQPKNQGGTNNQGTQNLLDGLIDLYKAAQGQGTGGSGGSGTGGGSSSGGSSSGGSNYGGEECASPGVWDGTCCRCPNGRCEYFGQGCEYWDR